MERTLDHLTVLIDGLALLKARAGLEEEIGRPIDLDFRRLFYEASWGIFEPERSNSKRVVRAEFFARGLFEPDDAYDRPSLRRSDFFAHGLMEEHELFYDQLQQIGYRIHGDPRLEGFTPWAPPTDEIVDLLRNEVGPHSGNLLYVGYEGDESDIRDALLDVARQVDGSRIRLGQFQVDDSQRYEDLGGILVPKLDIASDLGMTSDSIYRPRNTPHVVAHSYTANGDTADKHASIERAPRPRPALTPLPRPLIVLIDVENVDGVLGHLIGDKNLSRDTRPDYSRARDFFLDRAGQGELTVIAFLQAFDHNAGFARYLRRALGFEVVELKPEAVPKNPNRRRSVVDEAIISVLRKLRDRHCDVIVVSNDGDYFRHLADLRDHGIDDERRFTVIGFVDMMSGKYVVADWIETLDLVDDVRAFRNPPPRLFKPMSVDEFDPGRLLGDLGLDPPDGPDAA